MNSGENPHGHMARIIADEHFVDFQNRPELFVERLCRNVSQIEINLVLAIGAKAIETHLKDLARGNIAGDQIAVSRIFLLEKDRKSTRLNSSHVAISYAVFCLKKKKK